ncbi:MAG: type II toxin-antitoxin system MqsA family antitoxin [Candidatus Xenobia bacterium]
MKCICGETAVPTYLARRAVVGPDGLKRTLTDVPAEVCPRCKEIYFTPEVSAMMRRLVELSPQKRIQFPSSRPLTPEAIQQIRQQLNLSQAKLGSLLGLTVTSVASWEQGKRHPDGPSRVLLRLIAAMGPLTPPVRRKREQALL